MINEEPSVPEMAALWRICQTFIKKQDVHCEETIYQTDRIAENALQLIEDICNEVGYNDDE